MARPQPTALPPRPLPAKPSVAEQAVPVVLVVPVGLLHGFSSLWGFV